MAGPAAPQFGEREPGRDYADRPVAFGLAEQDGRVWVVRVDKPGEAPTWALPGGALDPGEDDAAAMVREFAEETGLAVRCGALVARADQYVIKAEQGPVNNRGGFYLAEVLGPAPEGKQETDHTPVLLEPSDALARMEHDAHAWALSAWLRSGRAARRDASR